MATLTAAQKRKISNASYKNDSTLSKIQRKNVAKNKSKPKITKKSVAKKALKKVPYVGTVLTAGSLLKNGARAVKTTLKNRKMVSEKELNAAIKKGFQKVNKKIKGPIEKGHKKGVAAFKKKVDNAPVPAWAKSKVTKTQKQNKVKVKKTAPVVKGPSKVTKKQKQTKKPIKKTNISNAVVGGGAAVSALTLSGGKGKKGSSISKQKSNPNATAGQHSTSSRHTPLTAKSKVKAEKSEAKKPEAKKFDRMKAARNQMKSARASMGFKKGGRVDGCATRGLTRAKRSR